MLRASPSVQGTSVVAADGGGVSSAGPRRRSISRETARKGDASHQRREETAKGQRPSEKTVRLAAAAAVL